MAELRLLGPVEFVDDAGRAVRLGGPKPRALLAMLALHVGHATSVGALVDGVWGDRAPDTVVSALQVHISALRRSLAAGNARVDHVDGGYRLSLPAGAIDLHVFEAMVAEGRASLRGGDLDRAHEVLARAIGLWRGRPFEGLDSAPFVGSARPAVESSFAAAAVEYAECLIGVGRHDEAAVAAERLIAHSPYDERGWETAMLAHYRAGRQAEALECFQRARRVLADELGLDPGPRLVELERAVLEQSIPPQAVVPAGPVDGGRSAPDPQPVGRRLPSVQPLVGRGQVVERVAGWLAAGGRLVTLVGLGGIGKTSVATALAGEVRTAGGDVWFVDLSTATDTHTAADTLARAVGVGAAGDPTDRVLEWASAATGLLVLDNLEQVVGAGPLVRSLISASAGVQVLATSRIALHVRDERVVALEPLPVRDPDGRPGDATRLFRERAELVRSDLDEIDDDVVADICELTAGIPLAVELAALQLRSLAPAQLLKRLETMRSTALDAVGPDGYPERHRSLRAVLDSTIGLLPPSSLAVLAHTAVADGLMTVDLLERSCRQRGIDAVAELAVLFECGVVRRVDDRLQVPPPIRQYVDAAVDAGEVDRARDAVFAAVAELVGEAEPCWFGSEADGWRQRLEEDAAAIDAALAGHAKAARRLEFADLVLGLGQYWLQTGRLVDALTALDEVAASPAGAIDPHVANRASLLRGCFASYLNRPDTAEILGDALEHPVGHPDRTVVNAWCCLGAYHVHRHADDDARRCSDAARASADESGDPALVALARDFAGYVAFYLGDHDTAIRLYLQAIDDARRQGDHHALALLLASTAEAMLDAGRFEDAGVLAGEAFDLAREVDLGIAITLVLIMLGASQIELGRPAAAWGLLVEHLRYTRERYPDPLAAGDSLAQLAAVRAALGDDEAAARTWGASAALHTDLGVDPDRRRPRANQRRLDLTRHRLGDARFDALALAGSADPRRVMDDILDVEQPSSTG